jgi:hypothetical protein
MNLYHLAQANVARMRAPLDDPSMADFVALLDPVNEIADKSPGFVWRLQTETGNSADVRVFDDPRILFNMSVWTSIDALRAFAYQSQHLDVFRQRQKWFERFERGSHVLWWLPVGRLPTVAEACTRFTALWEHGPLPEGFTFQRPYAPPAEVLRPV